MNSVYPMGMFDYYVPVPTINCPGCGAPLDEWQGKDGPCALMTWKQGEPASTDQPCEDDLIGVPKELLKPHVPQLTFSIHAYCENDGLIYAECQVENGTWAKTTVINPKRTQQG